MKKMVTWQIFCLLLHEKMNRNFYVYYFAIKLSKKPQSENQETFCQTCRNSLFPGLRSNLHKFQHALNFSAANFIFTVNALYNSRWTKPTNRVYRVNRDNFAKKKRFYLVLCTM